MMGRRDPRTTGRHRSGQTRVPVHRRLWDGPARAEAERLERSWPGWVILYGVGSRRFFAMAAWPVPEPVMVSASSAEGLEERMGEAETALLTRLGTPPVPGPSIPPGRRPRVSGVRRRAGFDRGLPYRPQGNAA